MAGKQEIIDAKDNFLLKCRQATNQSDNLKDFIDEIDFLYDDLIFLVSQAKEDKELTLDDATELGGALSEAKNARETLYSHVKNKFASFQ